MNPYFYINIRIRGKNLIEILGPMEEKLDILGCFHLECLQNDTQNGGESKSACVTPIWACCSQSSQVFDRI
jgi:hypothetical protein